MSGTNPTEVALRVHFSPRQRRIVWPMRPGSKSARSGRYSAATGRPGAQAASASMVGPVPRRAGKDAGPCRSRTTCSVRPIRVVPRAPARAAIISLDGSLRPRSTSDRYCGETPARLPVSTSVSPCSARNARSLRPSASRHSGSAGAGSARNRPGPGRTAFCRNRPGCGRAESGSGRTDVRSASDRAATWRSASGPAPDPHRNGGRSASGRAATWLSAPDHSGSAPGPHRSGARSASDPTTTWLSAPDRTGSTPDPHRTDALSASGRAAGRRSASGRADSAWDRRGSCRGDSCRGASGRDRNVSCLRRLESDRGRSSRPPGIR